MLYREIIAVGSEIHTKHINTLCGQNVELLNVKRDDTYGNHWGSKDYLRFDCKASNCRVIAEWWLKKMWNQIVPNLNHSSFVCEAAKYMPTTVSHFDPPDTQVTTVRPFDTPRITTSEAIYNDRELTLTILVIRDLCPCLYLRLSTAVTDERAACVVKAWVSKLTAMSSRLSLSLQRCSRCIFELRAYVTKRYDTTQHYY
jgi:hypothetical protein